MFLRIFIAIFIIPFLTINCQLNNLNFTTIPEYSYEMMFFSGIVSKITDNSPLDSVEVYVEQYGIVGYTNNEGFFTVEAPVNISKLFFRKTGYTGASQVFLSSNERKKEIDIKLFPENPDEKEQELIKNNYKLANSNDSLGDILNINRLFYKSTSKTEVPATIRVLMPDKTVVVMDMNEYLKGVVPSEVPPSWEMDALKAQAVAARSYATANFKHNSEGADVCTTTHCQAWKPDHNARTDQAVNETSNMSVKYGGEIINALFFSHCDGHTKNNEDVWGGTPVPYLRSKSCTCGYTFHNAHGVGMCQYGCQAMASNGSSWEKILKYYYTGTTIDKPSVTIGTLKGVIYYGSDKENLNNRIVGATIRLNKGQQTTSGDYGLYTFDIAPGEYTVIASKAGYESASLSREVTSGTTIWGSIQLNPVVGMSEVSSKKGCIYPNPANGFINIELASKAQVIIYNLTGHIVFNKISEEKITINVSDFKRGVYVVNIISPECNITEKIVLLD